MNCSKCGSENVNIQVVTESKFKNKHHSIWWWIFFGWWWNAFLWIFFFIVKLILLIFGKKKQKIVQKHISKHVCQSCGHMWNV